jgi:hypothetical protein
VPKTGRVGNLKIYAWSTEESLLSIELSSLDPRRAALPLAVTRHAACLLVLWICNPRPLDGYSNLDDSGWHDIPVGLTGTMLGLLAALITSPGILWCRSRVS